MEVNLKAVSLKKAWAQPVVKTGTLEPSSATLLMCSANEVDCNLVSPGCGCRPGSDVTLVCENDCGGP